MIERRCITRRNGASWQVDAVHRFEQRGATREAALGQMLELYCEGMHSNEPVHTWPLP